jgi:hypothetical protein
VDVRFLRAGAFDLRFVASTRAENRGAIWHRCHHMLAALLFPAPNFCDAEGAIAIRLRPGWKRKGRQAHHTGCSNNGQTQAIGVLRPSRQDAG